MKYRGEPPRFGLRSNYTNAQRRLSQAVLRVEMMVYTLTPSETQKYDQNPV